MPTHRQITTEAAVSVSGPGTSGTGELRVLFPGSPLYDGTYTEARLREVFTEQVLAPEVNDGGHTFGLHNRDYVNAPNTADVVAGGGGLPASAHAPNIASPAIGSGQNPRTIPEAGVEATLRQPHGGGAFLGNGLASPHDTSTRIATQNRRLGDYIFGQAYRR